LTSNSVLVVVVSLSWTLDLLLVVHSFKRFFA
jgi:hypothetical protein